MDLTATEVMRRNLQTVLKTMSLPALEKSFVESGASGFPVLDGDQLVGVVSRSDVIRQLNAEQDLAARTSDFYRDASGFHEIPVQTSDQIANRVGERMQHLTVADVMHHQLFAVGPNQILRTIAGMMLDNDIHRVLVTHEGRLLGLVSTTDFVRLYAEGKIKRA